MSKLPLALGLLVAAGLLIGGALWLLPREATEAPDTVDPTETGSEPVVEAMPTIEGHLMGHSEFPFAAFQADIDRLRRPEATGDDVPFEIREQEHNILVEKHRFNIRLEQATPKQIVDFLRAEYAKVGIEVTDLDFELPDQWKFDIFMTDTHAYDVIARIMKETGSHVRYAYSEYGICIGTEQAIQEWQIRSKHRRAREEAASELDDALLDAMVPAIILENAHVGAVTRYLEAQTGVEIVISPQIWHRTLQVDWRTEEPMTLREALKKLADKYRAVIRIDNERAFLIDP